MNSVDRIEGVFIGAVAPLTGERDSAIAKHAVTGAIELTSLGLHGDAQADRVNHGGPERALLHYCARHYADWARACPQAAALFTAPGFGENLSSAGMDEETVCIGDIYRIGSARVQVSQPRSPCWKLNTRFGIPDLAQRVQDSQRCGWLYRVLEPGELAAGDSVELLERPHPDFSVAAVMRTVNAATLDRGRLAAIVALPTLSANWRAKAERRLSGHGPDARARLQGDKT